MRYLGKRSGGSTLTTSVLDDGLVKIGWQIQDRLQTEIVPGYRYFNDIGRSLRRPYTKNARNWPWFGPAYWFANVWLDSSHSDFSGRPA